MTARIVGEKGDLAKRFVENFYRTFDANRADLANLYHEDSELLLDGHHFVGKEAILAKLTSLPFQQSQHHITTIVAMASDRDRDAAVVVVGDIRLDGEQDSHGFVENFTLIPTPKGDGSFLVYRDLFRMDFWNQRSLASMGSQI